MKITDISPRSNARHKVDATVVKVCITNDGGMRIIKNPIPGIELSLRHLSSRLTTIVEDCGEDLHLIDVVGLDGPESPDAKTRECLRSYRADTGILINPLGILPGRKPLEVPEGAHCIFWAYHK